MSIIDDTNSALTYSGAWTYTPGSSGQEGSAVRSTTQVGASVRLRFRGTRVKLFVTVKAYGDRVSCDINFDGAVTNAYRDPHYIDYYRDMWFDTHPVANGEHTITVTNRGTDGGHPFQFDYFEIDGTPIGAAPAPPTTPRTTSTPAALPRPSTSTRFVTQTQVQTQVSTQTRAETVVVQTSVSTIVGNNMTRLTTITSSSTSTAPSSHRTQHVETETNVSILPNGQATTVTTVKYLTAAPDSSVGISPGSALSKSDGAPIGLILGTIFGGLVVLGLALILFRIYRKRRRPEPVSLFRLDGGSSAETLPATRTSPFLGATSTMYTDHRQDEYVDDAGTMITDVLPPYHASGTSERVSGAIVPFPNDKPAPAEEKESLL